MQPVPKSSLYDQLLELPEILIGEIIDGQLHTHPRPGGKHILISSNVGSELHGPFQKGKNGPGGWWILQEPEVHLSLDNEVAVPDLAGWRKERLPEIPESHKFTVIPYWICEIFSPATETFDRQVKMPLYARYAIRFLWLIHPINKTLEAFHLVDTEYSLQGVYKSGDKLSIMPFQDIELKVSDLLE
jgi:Uma2 family endonuclease